MVSLTKSSGVGSDPVHQPAPSPRWARMCSGPNHPTYLPGLTVAATPSARPPTCAAPAPPPRALSRSAPPPASNLAPTEVALEDVLRILTSAWRGVAGVQGGEGLPVPRGQDFRQSRKTLSLALFKRLPSAGWEGKVQDGPGDSRASSPTTCPWRHGESLFEGWSNNSGKEGARRSVL